MSKSKIIMLISIVCAIVIILISVVVFLFLRRNCMQGTCGDGLTWTYDGNGTLTISGSGKMEDYTSPVIGDAHRPGWYRYLLDITTVVIEEGVESIGNWAFSYESIHSIDTVTLPTTLTRIGNCAFRNVYLYDLKLPDNLTEIGTFAFDGCSTLTNINLPEGVTQIMNYTFKDCSSLSEITLPSGVTTIGVEAFSGCVNLKKINFSENVKSIGLKAFSRCYSLETISFPKSLIKLEDYVFEGCRNLREITFRGNMPFQLTDRYGFPEYLAIFMDVTATAYYPANNTTWTSSDFSRYLHDEGIRWVTQ